MADIVVRLRIEGSELCIEAADIIEHLREALGFANTALMTIKGTLEPEPRAKRGGLGHPDDPPFSITDAAPNTPR